MVVGGSTPSLQYPTLESLVYGDQEALVEGQLATPSVGSSSKFMSSSLLRAAEVYLCGLEDEVCFQELIRVACHLSPLSSRALSLEIHFKQPDHTTTSTSVTSSASMLAPSSLHQPNHLVSNRVDITIQVEEWRRSILIEQYQPY